MKKNHVELCNVMAKWMDSMCHFRTSCLEAFNIF